MDVTYDVGFRADGKLTALRLRGGMLAGHAKDLSDSDIDMLRQGSDMVRPLDHGRSTARVRRLSAWLPRAVCHTCLKSSAKQQTASSAKD